MAKRTTPPTPPALRLCPACWDLLAGVSPCRCSPGAHEAAPYLTIANAVDAIRALVDVRDLLWPRGNPDAEWSADTIEAIAERLAFLRPASASCLARVHGKPPCSCSVARRPLRSVPR